MDLIQKYTPRIYFHRSERYFPVDAEWVFKNSKLYLHDREYGEFSNSTLWELSKEYKFAHTEDLVVDFPIEICRGQNVADAPIYCVWRETADLIILYYISIYAYNGSYPILGGVESVGEHKGDIEHITVEIHKSDGQLNRVFFGAHAMRDGRWVSPDQIEFEDGRIVAYSALDGHGLYPKPGAAIRLGGLANDILEKSIRWDPKPIHIPNVNEVNDSNKHRFGWVAYSGRFGGREGITWLTDKGWYNNYELSERELKPPAIISSRSHKAFRYGMFSLLALCCYVALFAFFYLYDLILPKQPRAGYFVLTHFLTLTSFLLASGAMVGVAKAVIGKVGNGI